MLLRENLALRHQPRSRIKLNEHTPLYLFLWSYYYFSEEFMSMNVEILVCIKENNFKGEGESESESESEYHEKMCSHDQSRPFRSFVMNESDCSLYLFLNDVPS